MVFANVGALDHRKTGALPVAIYRCEVKNISRGQGRSCVAAAAYRSASELQDERQQLTHDYARKTGVEHAEIVAPDGAPSWALDRQSLWNRIDAAEKRKDARTAKEVLVALPRELTLAQQVELVRDFARTEFASKGLVADVSIHAPDALDGGKQPHAHILIATRALEADGFAKGKDKSLDQPQGIEAIRERWATHANHSLERAGLEQRLDHRSLEKQRIAALQRGDEIEAIRLDRAPEPKIGPVAAAMVRTGRSEEAHAWRDASEVRKDRGWRDRLAETLRTVQAKALELGVEIGSKARQLAEAAKSFLDLPEVAAAGQALQWREAENALRQRQDSQQQARKQTLSRDWKGFSR